MIGPGFLDGDPVLLPFRVQRHVLDVDDANQQTAGEVLVASLHAQMEELVVGVVLLSDAESDEPAPVHGLGHTPPAGCAAQVAAPLIKARTGNRSMMRVELIPHHWFSTVQSADPLSGRTPLATAKEATALC